MLVVNIWCKRLNFVQGHRNDFVRLPVNASAVRQIFRRNTRDAAAQQRNILIFLCLLIATA